MHLSQNNRAKINWLVNNETVSTEYSILLEVKYFSNSRTFCLFIFFFRFQDFLQSAKIHSYYKGKDEKLSKKTIISDMHSFMNFISIRQLLITEFKSVYIYLFRLLSMLLCCSSPLELQKSNLPSNKQL